jgi:hypothetical protein
LENKQKITQFLSKIFVVLFVHYYFPNVSNFFYLSAEGALHDGRAEVRFPFAHHKHSADSSTFGKLDLHLFQMISAFVIKIRT